MTKRLTLHVDSGAAGADPGNMKGGASRKGRSPVRVWIREGEHPPPASPEAKFFAFYNLLTI